MSDRRKISLKSVELLDADTGFARYLAQEFIPKRDPMTSLAEAAGICDV